MYAPLRIQDRPLPYVEKLARRDAADIDLAVIHCTELPNLEEARHYGERACHPSGTGNSGHYYIDRDGSVHCFVAPLRVAHHVRNYNDRAIGIELVNKGRYPLWFDSGSQDMSEPYANAQLESLAALLRWLLTELPRLAAMAGHEDLDRERVPSSDDPECTVFRKRDPGSLFPWQRVVHASGLRRIRTIADLVDIRT